VAAVFKEATIADFSRSMLAQTSVVIQLRSLRAGGGLGAS